MDDPVATDEVSSPFHEGERAIQERVGVKERILRFAHRAIRDHMPDQHRAFYGKLPFLWVGHVDDEGWPWASMLTGKSGFMQTPTDKTLRIAALPAPGDPLRASLKPGLAIGALGIEPHTRRRNRFSSRVLQSDHGIELSIDQTLGNCPQYIQTRSVRYAREPDAPFDAPPPEHFTHFDKDARALIENADTFFVASAASARDHDRVRGADVSHRGGRPGFVGIEGNTLTIPDFVGNFLFNTLGNLHTYPRAGLTFLNFETGEHLLLTGTTEIIWDGPEVDAFRGAERLWRFTLDHGVRLRDAMALRFEFGEYSPNTKLAGTFAEAKATEKAEGLREEWRPYRVARVVTENSADDAGIRSFYLEADDGQALAQFKAGQHLVLRLKVPGVERAFIRTYTLSSAPGDPSYRISVKRDGVVSRFLHDHVREGALLEAKAPQGCFTFDASEERPALLLAGGVGVTPMMSMARHAVMEGLRTRATRHTYLVHATRNAAHRAFFDEARRLETLSQGALEYRSVLTRPAPDDSRHGEGRLDVAALRSLLPLDDYDVYLCGPGGFVQAMYDACRTLGVVDERIFTEAFGPSSLRRDSAETTPDTPEADEAFIEFSESSVEMAWAPQDGTLLEFAEAHGIEVPYGCRSGSCGTCARPVEGAVRYQVAPTAEIPEGCALLCQATPARRDDGGPVHLKIVV